jgi:DNA-binding NtrC family response regulator
MILHITNDLMMSSTARSHANSQGVEIKFASTFSQAIQELSDAEYQLCLADLQAGGMDMEGLAAKVKEIGVRTIVYVQHVNVEIIQKANELGFAEVMTRGQFNKNLGAIVGGA